MRKGAIIAPNWVGDAVMSLPAMHAIGDALPGAEVDILARPSVAGVYRAARVRAAVVQLPSARGIATMTSLCKVARGFGASVYEFAIVFPNSLYSAVLARAIRARVRVGYRRDGRAFLLTHAVARPKPGETPPHESYYYLELLRRARINNALPRDPVARLYAPPEAVEGWRRRLAGGASNVQRLVAIHAGATFGTAKRWLPRRFGEIARRLAVAGTAVVFVGSGAERALAQWVIRLAGLDGRPHVTNVAGETTLEEAIALLAAVDALVCNDSGPMHLAAAVGTPVVAIFGSTNEKETFPLASGAQPTLIKTAGVGCSPCKLRDCPIDHRCMTWISVNEVMAVLNRALTDRAASAAHNPQANQYS
jgi:heptosyltransferase-2